MATAAWEEDCASPSAMLSQTIPTQMDGGPGAGMEPSPTGREGLWHGMGSEQGESCLWQKHGDSWWDAGAARSPSTSQQSSLFPKANKANLPFGLAGTGRGARLQSVIKGKQGGEMSQEKIIPLAQGGNGKV